ncbi:MAG: glycosyltransferase [Anaerolineae bacterium]|nr:glycosyltransferase [Anaerolineae bacterium]
MSATSLAFAGPVAGRSRSPTSRTPRPSGFSANQNQMLRRATGRYLMPLNSDIVIHPGALQDLVAFMDAHPRCGLAGPKLLHGDGSLQRSPMDDRAVIMQRATYDFVRARYPTSRWGEIRVGTALGLAFRWILSGRPEQRAALRRRIAMRV